MPPLTANERLIWAATYAAEWRRGSIEGAAERAWQAVADARGRLDRVRAIWGEDDPVYQALKQMIQPE
jgi:hypothetical protein